MYLHQAAIYLGFPTPVAPAAKQGSYRHFRWLLVIAPLLLDTFLETSSQPAAQTAGDAVAQLEGLTGLRGSMSLA
jgi:hypothetical protein